MSTSLVSGSESSESKTHLRHSAHDSPLFLDADESSRHGCNTADEGPAVLLLVTIGVANV
jgi:hypothetical protein